MPKKVGGARKASAPAEAGGNAKRRRTSGQGTTGEADSDEEPLARSAPDPSLTSQHQENGTQAAAAAPAPAASTVTRPVFSDDDSDDDLKLPDLKALAAQASEDSDESSGDEAEAGGKSSSSSSSSDSSSSSSSESESESERPAGEQRLVKLQVSKRREKKASAVVEEQEEPQEEDAAGRQIRSLEILRRAQLKRDELISMLLNLPEDVRDQAVINSIVRVVVHIGSSENCLVCTVSAIEAAPFYNVRLASGEIRPLGVQLRCKRGESEKYLKISSISNQEVTEAEFAQWTKLNGRRGLEDDYFNDQLKQKAEQINSVRRFTFDEKTVGELLRAKPSLEFNAQKEARMSFLVQCALSQMDISGIRDNEAQELEGQYNKALDDLHLMQAKAAEEQVRWFQQRPGLYSLKEINKKNLALQIKDDRHALEVALEAEASATKTLNPFQRRDCRPVCAWDTKLTHVEGLSAAPEAAPAAAPPASPEPSATVTAPAAAQAAPPALPATVPSAAVAAPAAAVAPASESAPLAVNGAGAKLSRVDYVLKAHRRANLLASYAGLMSAQAA